MLLNGHTFSYDYGHVLCSNVIKVIKVVLVGQIYRSPDNLFIFMDYLLHIVEFGNSDIQFRIVQYILHYMKFTENFVMDNNVKSFNEVEYCNVYI